VHIIKSHKCERWRGRNDYVHFYDILYGAFLELDSLWAPLKGIIHPKMKIMSLITHPMKIK